MYQSIKTLLMLEIKVFMSKKLHKENLMITQVLKVRLL